MDYPIDISSGSDDEEVQDELIRQKDGTVITDEKLIYQAALQDLNQPKTERDLPYGVLSFPLMRHQKIALEWMRQKEKRSSKNCMGGILADDQGLGKTISTIALILLQKLKSQSKLKERKRSRKSGGTLVVCPASVVKQWAKEIYDKVSDEHKLSVLVYHGKNRIKDPTQIAKYDVVVTTYALVTNEVPPSPMGDTSDTKKGGKVSVRRRSSRGALAKVRWLRVVLDEAQTIKNHKTQVARACCSLRAKRRWCLSGTPIQNEIFDLYSYFKFLRYYPYAMHESFRQKITRPISKSSLRGYKKLQAILRAIMLRRTKATILDGQPIINLPPKIVNLSKVDFSLEEYSFYAEIEADAQERFEKYAAEGTLYENYANMLVMLLRLRQACDHPKLVNFGPSGALWREPLERKPRESLISLLSYLELDSSFTICCSVCKDPPKERLITLCGHVFCYQCVLEYLYGDQTCPVPGCGGKLGFDAVFSESILRTFLDDDEYDDDDDYDREKPLVLQKRKFVSTKVKAVMEILESLAKQGSPTNKSLPIKTIVFSQWTGMLDLVEHCLNKDGIESRRLDGTMSLGTRDIAVKEFNNDPNVQVMLMSLKAGNLGLNMVAACHVILLDLWWNPTTEDQAIDRAHRIGQTRTVTVTRITIKNTVEERILTLQEKKREIVASALGEDLGELSATRLTVEDLEYLFYGN